MSDFQITPLSELGSYKISGTINADTDFTVMLEDEATHLILSLESIEEISSYGVKRWIEGILALQARGKTVEYRNCAEIFVEQCNLVLDLCQGVTIASFQTTFMCDECDVYDLQVLTTRDLNLEDLPPIVDCPNCGTEMITEEGDVFRFLF